VWLVCVALLQLFAVAVKGQSTSDTLDVINWNLEFFGDNSSELPEEMIKVKTIMQALDADVYALTEVVNTDSLNSLVQSLNGYNYVVSPFGSFAGTPSSSQYESAQKLAFVYRTSMVRNVSGRALLKSSTAAYNYWASGRFPYLVSAEVLGRDNQWQQFQFVIIHAKANSDYSSCFRRYSGALEMKDTLDTYFANDRIIILGDFNDDLDISICASFTESNYAEFVKDSVDANSYASLTLPLSVAGVSSIAGYSSFLDHVIVSNEVRPYYVAGSAEMLKDKVNSLVSSYSSYVSDHFPVRTKFVLEQPLSTDAFTTRRDFTVYPIPASDRLQISDVKGAYSSYELLSTDGKVLAVGTISGAITNLSVDQLSTGYYFLRLYGKGKTTVSKVSVVK